VSRISHESFEPHSRSALAGERIRAAMTQSPMLVHEDKRYTSEINDIPYTA
jgi:hypothetical protein